MLPRLDRSGAARLRRIRIKDSEIKVARRWTGRTAAVIADKSISQRRLRRCRRHPDCRRSQRNRRNPPIPRSHPHDRHDETIADGVLTGSDRRGSPLRP